MRRLIKATFLVGTLLAFLGIGNTAWATLIYNLDKVITGEGYTTGWDFGQITLTQNGNNVDMSVELNDSSNYINSGSHIKVVALNYNPLKGFGSTVFSVANDSILNDEDNVKMGGFKGYFDLEISGETGNLHDHDYSNSISWSGGTITPLDFNLPTVKDVPGVYMAVHIGGLETNIAGSDSVWAGANPVPEPATILLLGTGLVGLAGTRMRKKLKK